MGSLGVGLVGIVVPLLPTTPFLLLAAGCFMRSSDRLYRWLLGSRWLGAYIRNYREHRAMTRRAKACALALLWGMIGFSAARVAEPWWMRIVLAAVAAGVTAHLLCLRTMPSLARANAPEGPDGNDDDTRTTGGPPMITTP